MTLSIEQLEFAREIGAEYVREVVDVPLGFDFYKDVSKFGIYSVWLHTYKQWESRTGQPLGWDSGRVKKIDFTPLEDYYADKAVDIAATGGDLEYDPADVAFKRPAADMVNHPPHYQTGGIECIDAIRAALGLDGFVAYCRGNAINYTWQAGKKGETAQNLKKAAWYLNRAADEIEKQEINE